MAVTEEGRHRLYQWVESQAGTEVAIAMMELLPPVGWADVATKQDLHHLEQYVGSVEQRLEQRIDSVEKRLEAKIDLKVESAEQALRAEFASGVATLQREMRLQLLGMIGAMATVAGIVSRL